MKLQQYRGDPEKWKQVLQNGKVDRGGASKLMTIDQTGRGKSPQLELISPTQQVLERAMSQIKQANDSSSPSHIKGKTTRQSVTYTPKSRGLHTLQKNITKKRRRAPELTLKSIFAKRQKQ